MTAHVNKLNGKELLKIVLAVNKFMAEVSQLDSDGCRPLFLAAAKEAAEETRLRNLRPADLLLLTQGVLSLGGQHRVVLKILDFWVLCLRQDAEGYSDLPSDDLAQLVRLVAMVAPQHDSIFEAFGQYLIAGAATLSASGWALLDAAFPGGSGPAFPSKPILLRVLASSRGGGGHASVRQSAASRSRSCDRSRYRKSRRRSSSSSLHKGRGSSSTHSSRS